MNISTKLLKAAAGQAVGAGLDIDEVFSTFVADATGSGSLTINNAIDLSSEGGIVWVKSRNNAHNHYIFDTNVGSGGYLQPNSSTSGLTGANYSFTSTGLTDAYNNYSGNEAVWWTFRKAKKFFDVVTYTGDGTNGRQISHNLGSVPGMLIVKRTNSSDDWRVFHRSQSNKYANLNSTFQFQTDGGNVFGNPSNGTATAPTSTHFTVDGGDSAVNGNGSTYVAYIFAHNNSDGGFGPDSDQDIIKCESFTGSSSSDVTVNVGFEPQWLLTFRTGGGNWSILDSMRGILTGSNDPTLFADSTSAENTGGDRVELTPTGFIQKSGQTGNETVIYMAIRRGPLAAPEDATKVFKAATYTSAGNTNLVNLGFNPDFNINTTTSSSSDNYAVTRLLGKKYVKTNSNASQGDSSETLWNTSSNFINLKDTWWGGTTNVVSWSWKRAPSYFDVVAYTGAGAAQTVNHNLGVVPEMMWIKNRGSSENWAVYHSALGTSKYLHLNTTNGALTTDAANRWNNTSPTATQFTVGTSTEVSHFTRGFIAYLFATVAGVSKCGSYTGNGSTTGPIVDCGFSSGARFVLIKRTDTTGDWVVYDTERGITAGDDKTLELNTTDAETTGQVLNPHSSGFQLATADSFANASGGTYIFYAIA